MATNPLFNLWNNEPEQNLTDDLIREHIQLVGMDVFYIPRTMVSEDKVFGEDRNASFLDAYEIEMSVKTIDNFGGDGDMMSKFGFVVRDSMTLVVSNTRFEEQIGQQEGFSRPREGDLIYLPLNRKLFEIRHVEHEDNFYAFGKLYYCDLKLELFEFSGEVFDTGIPDVDAIAERYDFSGTVLADIEEYDAGATNEAIETDAVKIIDFSENNVFGSDTY